VVIDPSMTAIWRRRVVAAVIDMALVVGVLATLVHLQVVRLTRDGTGLFSPQDMDRYTELRSKPNQYLVLGDTTYVLAGAELIMTIVLTAVTIAAVYVLLPGYTGRSPGKLIGRLRILTVHGDVVDTSHTLVRSVVGLVDVFPVLVPGMVGARLARRSPLGQRLGDRVAGTVVVDASRPLAVVGLPQTPLQLPPPRRT
jgi:uncharacterized RDD family membrane protein YckC